MPTPLLSYFRNKTGVSACAIAGLCSGITMAQRRRNHLQLSLLNVEGFKSRLHLGGRIGVQWAGGRELSAETLMCVRARREREGTDWRLPSPRGATQACGGKRGVAEGEESERGVKSGRTGCRCLWVAIEGRGQRHLTECGLDGRVASRALQTCKTTYLQVFCYDVRQNFVFRSKSKANLLAMCVRKPPSSNPAGNVSGVPRQGNTMHRERLPSLWLG